MKTALLYVPSKKTEDASWSKPLNNYLLSVYGNTSEFQQDVADFDKLRQDIRGTGSDITSVKLNFQYFSRLEILDLRIPVAAINKNKKISFVWHDAFLPSSEHQQHALAFEKASVLFNLGSLMTKVAVSKYKEAQRASKDETGAFKEAVQLFQQAAGVFSFLAENFLHAPSSDLQPATVKFLIDLCLAQSQEIFTLRVIDGDLEQKKNSLIAKLCRSTANHFEACYGVVGHLSESGAAAISLHSTYAVVDSLDELSNAEDESVGEYEVDKSGPGENLVRANLDDFWVATIYFKSIYYRSLCYYFQGLQLEATSKYGDAIAYLQKSLNALEEILSSMLKAISKAGGEDAYELLDNYKYHKDALNIKLADLNKDNDLIYHDIVPSLVTLPEPKAMDSTSIIPMNKVETFNQISEYNYNNFLKNVVPINIHELLSYYSEEKSQLLRNELDEVDVSNEELLSVLEYLKLPKALVNIKEILSSNRELNVLSTESRIPPDLITKANEIALRYSQDVQNRRSIEELRKRIFHYIGTAESALSSQITASSGKFREDLIRLKKSLYDAASSDSRLFALVDSENSKLHEILGGGADSAEFRNLFRTLVPERQTSVVEEVSLLDMDDAQIAERNDTVEKQISALENLLNELNKIKTSKANLVAKLKSEIHNDDISDILMLNSKIKSTNEIKTVIFPEELKKFEPFSEELDGLIAKQLDMIAELKKRWDRLSSDPKVKEVQTSKSFQDELISQQLSRINSFYSDHWKKYTTGLAKGVEFYTQLANYAENISRTIQQEMRQLEQRGLEHSMGNLHLGQNYQATGQYSPGQMQNGPQSIASFQNTGLQHSASLQNTGPQNPGLMQSSGQFHNASAMQMPGQYQVPGQYQSAPYQNAVGSSAPIPGPDYGRGAPALPPKRMSQNSVPPQSPAPKMVGSWDEPNDPSALIYDQPSTYKPDMYNFFLKQG